MCREDFSFVPNSFHLGQTCVTSDAPLRTLAVAISSLPMHYYVALERHTDCHSSP